MTSIRLMPRSVLVSTSAPFDRLGPEDAPEKVLPSLGQDPEASRNVEVLSWNPLPQKEFLRPLLESTVGDIRAAVEFSVYGPVAGVHQVLSGWEPYRPAA